MTRRDAILKQRDDDEIERQEKVAAAWAVLKQHPEYLSSQYEFRKGWRLNRSEKAGLPGTPERFKRCKRALERFAEKHAKLVTDIPSQEAFAEVLYDAFEAYWLSYSGNEMDGRYLWQQFEAYRGPEQKQAHDLYGVVVRWITRSMGMAANKTVTSGPAVVEIPPFMPFGPRLDKAVAVLGITHDELAHRMGVKKTTYFAVKRGAGKDSSKYAVEAFLQDLNKSEPRTAI